MHLAFVTSLVVDGKPTTGFEVANEAIIAGLRAIGCKITVIGFRQPRQSEITDPQTVVLKTLSVENAAASIVQKIRWMAGALISGLPVGGSKLRIVAWQKLKTALLNAGSLDGVIVNSVQMPSAFPQLIDFAPFIYVAHNVEYRSAKQNSRNATGWFERYLYGRDARLLAPIEKNLCQKACHVFVLGEDDSTALNLEKDRATMLPLVFPAVHATGNDAAAPLAIDHDVGLIGTWTWQPNFVGLEWFLNEVVPLLDKDVTVSIAGSTPPVAVAVHQGVKFAGRVKSAEEFVARSRVLALVSRSGTGVQLKTIEAFQMGMPCIATKSSVRGVTSVPENCRVEDHAPDFARSLNAMVKGVREGDICRIDGAQFADVQRHKLHEALRTGLSTFGDC